MDGRWLTEKPVLLHLESQDGVRDRGLAEILPREQSQPSLLGLSEQQMDAPVLHHQGSQSAPCQEQETAVQLQK